MEIVLVNIVSELPRYSLFPNVVVVKPLDRHSASKCGFNRWPEFTISSLGNSGAGHKLEVDRHYGTKMYKMADIILSHCFFIRKHLFCVNNPTLHTFLKLRNSSYDPSTSLWQF
jgi:hypothetical protein